MASPIIIVQNDPLVPAGRLAEFMTGEGLGFRTVRLFAGDSLPRVDECTAVFVLGGTMGVHDTAEFPFLLPLMDFMREAAERSVPLLGICLGGQLLAAALGGEVRAGSRGEKGVREVALTTAGISDPLFRGLEGVFEAFQWHNDSFDLPADVLHLASSPLCPGEAFRYRSAYALQFHPEVDRRIVNSWIQVFDADPAFLHRYDGSAERLERLADTLFGNFLIRVCGADENR